MNTVRHGSRLVLIVSFVILAVFLTFWFVRKQASDPVRDVRPIPVSTVRPERASLRETLVLPAVLETRQTVSVVPRVPGLLLEVLAVQGDRVSEGEVLARIDSRAFQLELRAAESAWQLAEGSLARIRTVMESSGASRQQLDEARTRRDAALTEFELARMRFEYAEVRSPVSGLVLESFFDVGNLAPVDRPLFIIGDDSALQVKVRIPEKYWNRFNGSVPLRVVTSYPGGGGQEDAVIRMAGPSVSPEDRSFEVTCDIPQNRYSWPVGARVEIEFVLSEMADTWSLPLRALSGNIVWRVDDGRVNALESPEIFHDNRRFAVPGDWAGSLFVLDGQSRLTESLPVTPFESGRQL